MIHAVNECSLDDQCRERMLPSWSHAVNECSGLHADTDYLRNLEIIPKNLNEIVLSWIPSQDWFFDRFVDSQPSTVSTVISADYNTVQYSPSAQ